MDYLKANTRFEKINKIASDNLYNLVDYQKNIYLAIYEKDSVKINIYISKMTVATCIKHPKKGKTQLFRKGVNYELLEKIFKNPRVHTQKGYYTNN